jgi:hypothetical protein
MGDYEHPNSVVLEKTGVNIKLAEHKSVQDV